MRKLTLTLLLLFVGTTLAACGGDKVEDPKPVDEAEVVQSVERFWQLQDTNPETPAEQRLYCQYTLVKAGDVGAKYGSAEAKTSGNCAWADLKSQVAATTKDYPGENYQALHRIIAGIEFPDEGADAKWDCATMTITTNKRTFTTRDCHLRDRDAIAGQKGFVSASEPKPSASPEEAAFRLNSVLTMN